MNEITFTLTSDHLKLLRRMNVDWGEEEYGAPCIDSKRPYGNSDVEGDIADILGWNVDKERGLRESQSAEARKLHKETITALQICLCLGKFQSGVYEKMDRYSAKSWRRASV